jgi:hypothetical protein
MGTFEHEHTFAWMKPPVMVSRLSCTTPDEPGLMFSTRRGLMELACAFRTTEPATASRTTLLVTLSSALSIYVPGSRTTRPTAVLASALVRLTVSHTTAVPGGYGGGGRYGGEGGDGGGEGGGEGGEGGGGGDGEGGGGEGGGGGARGPQSVQSVPRLQSEYSAPGPPSSQWPSEA